MAKEKNSAAQVGISGKESLKVCRYLVTRPIIINYRLFLFHFFQNHCKIKPFDTLIQSLI
jgi:hypothetical protein